MSGRAAAHAWRHRADALRPVNFNPDITGSEFRLPPERAFPAGYLCVLCVLYGYDNKSV